MESELINESSISIQEDEHPIEEEEAFVPSSFSIPLHSILSSAQQRSLIDNDYPQYHKYLTNRISRIRHSNPVYKRKSGKKHVYQPRDFTSVMEANAHENYVLLAIYQVERAWAHAMELKQVYESTGLSKRQTFLKRLKKSVSNVVDLETLKEICDDTTRVEIDCYAAWIKGNYATELKNWKYSCEQYATAVKLCYELSSRAKAEQNLQSSDLFYSRAVNMLQPLLKYCQYELQQEGNLSKEDIDSIVRIATVNQDGDEEMIDNTDDAHIHVTFRGNEVPLTGDIRIAYIKIQNKKKQFQKCIHAKNTKASTRDSKFMDLLSSYDDLRDTIQKSAKSYEGMASGPAVDRKRFEFRLLIGFCRFQKLQLAMERNEEMVNTLRAQDVDGRSNVKGGESDASHQEDAETKYKKVEEIAHLYDALLQDARAIMTLPGSALDDSGEEEDEFLLEANANLLRIRAFRCYYIARMYSSDNVAKYLEALSLFDKASQLAAEASEEIAACQGMEQAECMLESLSDLEREIAVLKIRTKASAFLAMRGSGASSVTSGLILLDRLDDFDSGGKNYKIADVPMSLQPIACKPMFFDIANNYVREFPTKNLEATVNASKSKKSRGLFGWFQ